MEKARAENFDVVLIEGDLAAAEPLVAQAEAALAGAESRLAQGRSAAELALYPQSGCIWAMRVDVPGLPVNFARL